MDNLKIETIKGGAVLEMANKELERIFNDIADVNKKGDSKRELTVKVTFAPTEDARFGACKIAVASTLGKQKDVTTSVYFGYEDGKGIASEQSNVSHPQFSFETNGAN